MNIETKFDIGQEVYIIPYFQRKVICGIITKIHYDNFYKDYDIKDKVKGFNRGTYLESYIYTTPEEAEAKLKEME